MASQPQQLHISKPSPQRGGAGSLLLAGGRRAEERGKVGGARSRPLQQAHILQPQRARAGGLPHPLQAVLVRLARLQQPLRPLRLVALCEMASVGREQSSIMVELNCHHSLQS